jgi:hypothetical protein
MSTSNYQASEIEVGRVQQAAEGYTRSEVGAILAAIIGAGLALPRPGDGATTTLADERPRST